MPRQFTTQRLTPEQRFWSKVDPCRTDGCALFIAGIDNDGYGVFFVDGKSIKAHQFLVGKAPNGLEWDHVRERGCTHRNCVWPEHLEAVTGRENRRRGKGPNLLAERNRRTHCPRGHEYTAANTAHWSKGGGKRCRACGRLRKKV